jgi:hypothetical protein
MTTAILGAEGLGALTEEREPTAVG